MSPGLVTGSASATTRHSTEANLRQRPGHHHYVLGTGDAALSPVRAQVVAEAEGWSVFIPGLPIAADGAGFDEAISEAVAALREYAADWQERLAEATNHRNNWGLVQMIALSDDDQLRDWLVGSER